MVLDSLLRAFDSFYQTLDAVTVPAGDGARRIDGIAHAVALSEATAVLYKELAAVHELLAQERSKTDATVPLGIKVLESDSPDGPWTAVPVGAVRVQMYPIGGDGGNAVLLAAIDSAARVAGFPAAKWNALQAKRPGANHQRWHAGEILTAGDLAALESAAKLLRLVQAQQSVVRPERISHCDRVKDIARAFNDLDRRRPPVALNICRTPDVGDVVLPEDPEFLALAADAGKLLADLPEHWRFGIQSRTMAEIDPAKRWVGAVFDLANCGSIDVPNSDDAANLERIDVAARASALACNTLLSFADRPNWGKGNYATALEVARADADGLLTQARQSRWPDADLLYAYVCAAFNQAIQIAELQGDTSAIAPSSFVYAHARLEEYYGRADKLARGSNVLAQWPTTPGTVFGRYADDSALQVAMRFSQAVLSASSYARVRALGILGHKPPDLRVADHDPDPRIVAWRDGTSRELQEHTLPIPEWRPWGLLQNWPDTGRLASFLNDEYRRLLETESSTREPAPLVLFEKALKVVYDTGKKMESHPDTYADKGETAIRDHFITVLASHFDHVCGERFNKSGKTDIFVEHRGEAVLIAECKIWDGRKNYLDAIDQLLGYLPWRDARAAVFLFVKTKEIGPVLTHIEESTPTHASFVRAAASERPGWYNFELRLNNDVAQTVRVAVLCFHFPPNASGE